MTRILIHKFLYVCLSLLVASMLTFTLVKVIPGDPFQQEQALSDDLYQALRHAYGLDMPLHHQYLNYMTNLCSLDLGQSLVYSQQTVVDIIKNSFPTSALLGMEALAIAIPVGIFFGLWSAFYPHGWQNITTQLLATIGISIPSFILGTFLQYFLAVKLRLFPIACWGTFYQSILPALSLAALPAAFIARMTRSNMIEELKQGYIITARAKGLSECRIILNHALRNILLPILNYLGPLTAHTLTGSFIIEKIYGIAGLGYWFVASVSNRDYPVIMGITLFYCTILLLISFGIDVIALFLDPRIAYCAKKQGKIG